MAQRAEGSPRRRPRQGRAATAAKTGTGRALRRAAAAAMEDEIIRILYEFARSQLYPVAKIHRKAERMAIVATGGYGRGAAGARLRHRSAVSAALQADRLGRVDRGSDPLLPVGHGAEGRPRHALGRRMHPPGQGGHDHPHRHPRSALPARRPQALSTSW